MAENLPTVFYHCDIDGIVSYLVLCWHLGKKIPYVATTPMRLEDDWIKWEKENSGSNSRLYFLDLDVSKIGESIDFPSTLIIDHHKTNIYPFKKATAVIYDETSCAKQVHKVFFKDRNNTSLTNAQKTMIALADDYDSWTKATPLSEELNIVFHSLSNKVESFIEDYWDGFKPFDKFKSNTIFLYKKNRAEYLKTLKPFIGEIEMQGEPTKVAAVFSDKYISECCDHMFDKYNVDIAIAVMVGKKRIAVRRHPDNTKVDASKFVQRIAGGGGHEAAAGGNLTEEFMEFTKMLKPAL